LALFIEDGMELRQFRIINYCEGIAAWYSTSPLKEIVHCLDAFA